MEKGKILYYGYIFFNQYKRVKFNLYFFHF